MLLMKSLIIIPCTFDEQKINMIQKQCLLGDPLLNLLHKICKKKKGLASRLSTCIPEMLN